MIPWYEWIIYILALITIFTTLLIYVLPPIVNEPWTIQHTIIIVSHLTFIGLGYLLYGGVRLYEFKKTIKNYRISPTFVTTHWMSSSSSQVSIKRCNKASSASVTSTNVWGINLISDDKICKFEFSVKRFLTL